MISIAPTLKIPFLQEFAPDSNEVRLLPGRGYSRFSCGQISVQLRFNPPRGGFGTGTGNDTDSDTAGGDTGSDSASHASHPRPQDSHASHS